ncbi:MAG: tetratricopeptide repeat protein [Hymenobacter sp.]
MLEDYPKALERLLKAYTLMPDNAAVNYKLAEANLLSGNLRDATGYAEAAVQPRPEKRLLLPAAGPDAGQPEAVRGRHRHLRQPWCSRCPTRAPTSSSSPTCTWPRTSCPKPWRPSTQAEQQFGDLDEIAFKKQQIYLQARTTWPLALTEGETLITANPSEPRFVLAQAEMYAANNRLPDAIRVAEQALRLDPGNPQARLILADVYRQQNQPTEVEKQLRLAFDSPALEIDQAVRILAGLPQAAAQPKTAPSWPAIWPMPPSATTPARPRPTP